MSKRHGKVTRFGAKQTYDIVVMRPTGRSIEHRYTWDEVDEKQLKAAESARLQSEGALLLDLVMGPKAERKLYGMDKTEFFERASVL